MSVPTMSKAMFVVLPGSVGRWAVLEKIQKRLAIDCVEVVVLIPQEDDLRSAWARKVVGDSNYITYDGVIADSPSAISRIDEWSSTSQKSIAGVLCYDEFGLLLSAEICAHFQLPGTPPSIVKTIRDKQLFRNACDTAGLATVRHAKCTAHLVSQITSGKVPWQFPSILKPCAGAGSWCVMKIETSNDLGPIFSKLHRDFQASSYTDEIKHAGFVLEEFFIGQEVDIDGWCDNGEVKFALVSDNRPALPPGMAEVGGIYPSQLSPDHIAALNLMTTRLLRAVEVEAAKSIRATPPHMLPVPPHMPPHMLPITPPMSPSTDTFNTLPTTYTPPLTAPPKYHGAFCIEAIISADGVCFPIEINGRVSGAETPACVEAVSGHWLPARATELALNLTPTPPAIVKHSHVVSMNIHLHAQGKLTKFCDAKLQTYLKTKEAADACVQIVVFKDSVGQQLLPQWNAQSCLGWVAGGGPSADEARQNLELILKQLEVEVDNKPVDVVCI
eukprot:m.195467 g.195467  ORF g.195467 m.195467 type:complete len:501 (-) comp32569_c0_seq1:350-1852(-)